MPNNIEQYTGYYWVTKQSTTSARETGQPLTAGVRIKNADDRPPFMVVCEEIQTLIVLANEWPGSLWRVRVVTSGDMSGTIPNIWYRRASEIELIEKLPAGALFGFQGDKIVDLLNQIMTLTSSEVDALYANKANNSCAEEAYTRAWKCWNKNLKYPRSHSYEGGMTIASPDFRHDNEKSPTNHGFSLISDLIWRLAREIDGSKAFIEHLEYGETELELNPRWRAVSTAFLCKAMAISMSQHISATDVAALTQAWSSVFEQEESRRQKCE